MTKSEEKNINIETEEKPKNKEMLKVWETPELKVLSVPGRTQGGTYTTNPIEMGIYRPS